MNIFRIFRKNKKKIPIKRMTILICTLIMTTLAWFAFNKTLKTGINMHINTWNIKFYEKVDESLVEMDSEDESTTYSMEFSDIYPAMEDQEREVVIENNGEVDVTTTYTIESITMLGTTYEVKESDYQGEAGDNYIIMGNSTDYTEDNTDYTGTVCISDTERFPFTLKIENPKLISSGGGNGTITIIFSWTGTDETLNELDSTWGYNVAKYLETNPDEAPISMDLKITVYQVEGKY